MATQGIEICGEEYLAWEDPKDPSAIKDYYFDLSDEDRGGYLQGALITNINSITVEANSGLIVGDGNNGKETPTHDGKIVKFWLIAGGNIGNWNVTLNFTTDSGVTDEITKIIQVKET